MKHINVALFVPDEGCPNRCSFCNQKTISGKTKRLTEEDIHYAVKIATKGNIHSEGEIAFFGGSFTGIEREYMISLLSVAREYVEKGLFKGIRISTRPDYVDEEILGILKEYRVTSIELGCQSMDDEVLRLNRRGHTSSDAEKSARLIKKHGFELGLQMMTGLYGDTAEKSIKTAKKLIALMPDTVRIYPTVVLEDTELHTLYKEGKYRPQTLEGAIKLCSELLLMFHEKGIKVIRVGLHSGGNVEEGFVAGVYHPALRELCQGEIYLRKAIELMKKEGIEKGEVTLEVNKKYVSQMVGQKRCNIEKLKALGYDIKVSQSETQEEYEVRIKQ